MWHWAHDPAYSPPHLFPPFSGQNLRSLLRLPGFAKCCLEVRRYWVRFGRFAFALGTLSSHQLEVLKAIKVRYKGVTVRKILVKLF